MMKNTRFTTWNLFSTMLLILVLLAGSVGLAQAADKVNAGHLPLLSFAPLYIAVDKGFFTEQGIDTQLTRFASGAKMMVSLTAGKLDVSAGAPSVGLFNAFAQGATFRIVADKGQDKRGSGYNALIVRTDLLDSGKVKSFKDLKGMKISQFAPGSLGTYYMGLALNSNGMTFDDIKIVYMRPPNVIPAFKNKAIDAANTAEPWPTIAEALGLSRRLWTIENVPGIEAVQNGMITFSGKFRTERREVAARWMRAYVKAIRFYNARSLRDEEVIKILGNHIRTSREMIMKAAAHPFYLDPKGRPNVKSVMKVQSFLHKLGDVKKMTPAEQMFDLSFLPK